MNTNKIYFGKIYEINAIECDYFNLNVKLTYKHDSLMIVKKNIFGKKYMMDLNNGRKYNVELPTRLGALYVSSRYLESFNKTLDNNIVNLPKNKVLELGNKYINSKEK